MILKNHFLHIGIINLDVVDCRYVKRFMNCSAASQLSQFINGKAWILYDLQANHKYRYNQSIYSTSKFMLSDSWIAPLLRSSHNSSTVKPEFYMICFANHKYRYNQSIYSTSKFMLSDPWIAPLLCSSHNSSTVKPEFYMICKQIINSGFTVGSQGRPWVSASRLMAYFGNFIA